MTTIVRVYNGYTCGRESEAHYNVRDPHPGEAVEDWFEDAVHDLTGDGHPCGSREHAYYEAEVVDTTSPRVDWLVGETYTWEG